WALARGVVLGAVRACEPVDAEDAKGLASRACLFLAGPCGWAGTTAPDLRTLLTEPGIAAHLHRLKTAAKSGKTRENHRADLRRLARAVNGTHQPKKARATAPVEPVSALLLAVGSCPAPFTAAVAALGQLGGRPVSREALDPLAAWLAANAATDGPGTVRLLDAAAALAGVAPAAVEVVVPAARTPRPSTRTSPTPAAKRATSATTASAPARPPSRAAALRHAKAAAAAAAAVTAGPALAPAPDLDALPGEVRVAVLAYRPRGVSDAEWAPLAELGRRLMAGYAPASAANAGHVGSHVATFLRWVARWPGRADATVPLRAEELLVPGLVDAYLATLTAPDASKATVRSVLRRAVRSLSAAPASATVAYQPVAAPYGRAECARLVRLARNQPTVDGRRALSLLVGLGLGAGLDGRDLRHVTRDGFTDVEIGEPVPALAVAVGGTERPRTVVVARAYEPLVRESLALHDKAKRGRTAPVLGRKATRRNVTTPTVASAVTAQAGVTVEIEVNRLRATWLVACMSANVPLAALLAAAGLRSARTLTDLLAHCPAPDPAQVAVALAHLTTDTDTATATGDVDGGGR
ncbi:MAG TPA: hypothetical protein VFS29_05055, partial [Motilibacteraceae bacterium]|nr:hypothetical protein [Motilibacteraceae bacterium]